MGKSYKPRRNIAAAVESSTTAPNEVTAHQVIVQVTKPEGNNLYTCTLPNEKTILVEMDEDFRNTIYIKRRGFVLVDLTLSEERSKLNSKLDGRIINVVHDEKAWRKMPYWPKEFPKITYQNHENINPRDFPPSDSEGEV